MSSMTIRELIDSLEEFAGEHGDDTQVRIAHQPQWPFEYSIGEIVACNDDDDDEDDEDPGEGLDAEAAAKARAEAEDAEPSPTVIYIGEGQQLGYLGGMAARRLGWGRR